MTNKQVESCFLNHNSSSHFCCTDSLLMTHRGGLSLSIIIWRIGGGGGGGKFTFALGHKNSLGGPVHEAHIRVPYIKQVVYLIPRTLHQWTQSERMIVV